ncbi:hypothetical protein CEUSTIGMA_g2925.t1 [Chlamydomonas eustigma]|uniref:Calcium-binding protein 39 n=1 Tax=Chlamydomonas eustigma TaxID=1157962 RepID=A0A250WXZ0_9CHLO|nr:hypothetical protein CEUSTIGMA_g2925.t1 [Chlamydomonas eustigma]|eukprot:GAX75482.1 hypothetical protein CEUSTIGMA_g2925.t1 [Chlamydomonas eustigma]
MPLLESLKEALKADRPKTGAEILARLANCLNVIEHEQARDAKAVEKAVESIAKYLQLLLLAMRGDEEHQVTKESVLELTLEIVKTEVIFLLIRHLSLLGFETRKDVASLCSIVVRLKDDNEKSPGAQYVAARPYVLEKLFWGYEDPAIALVSGSMLRDCTRDEALAKIMLYGPLFLHFFEKVETPNFEIASDAFSTFKDLLTRHKGVVALYLQEHYAEFFAAYMKLLQSSNYVTRRQSLKLLGEMLLDRSNVKVMVKFVSEVPHLMQMMMLLKDQSRSIQFEAFHVFKVFVANPNKPQPIIDILTNNRDKLLKFLEEFHTERDEDEQFREEKTVLIKEISLLGAPVASAFAATENA